MVRIIDLHVLIVAVLLHDIARVKESNDKTGETDNSILGSKIAEYIWMTFVILGISPKYNITLEEWIVTWIISIY
jgi:HD superfamily phosphodiesterase